MSDPFIPHPSDDLKASTVITTVSEDALDHAASEAARQVAVAFSTNPTKSGRRAKALAASKQQLAITEPAPAIPEPQSAVVEPPVEMAPEAMAMEAAPAFQAPTPSFDAGDDPMRSGVESAAATSDYWPDALATATEQSSEPLPTVLEDISAPSEAVIEATTEVVETMSEASEIVAEEAPTAHVFITADALKVTDVMSELTLKVAQSVQQTMESSVTFWTSLLHAKSASEAMELNTTHLRQQMESLLSQSLEFSQLARKAATLSVNSMTEAFSRFRD